MSPEMNRREAIVLGAASLASLSFLGGADDNAIPPIVKTHDEMLEQMLSAQIVDAQNRWCGSIPDDSDLHHCTAAARLLRDASAAYFHPQSKFHADKGLFDRMKLAADFLRRLQNDEGNIDLLSTNFNSPPDTAFTVHDAAAAAALAQMHGDTDVLSLLEEFLRRAGQGLTGGGVHTPNHRWAVCAALAQINALFPDTRYVDRIDQWLAEGIDIDEEGQYTERSTAGYNAVVDKALVIAAHKLNRPELLDPVRKNLDAMVYLLHPNGEVVTEISSRQDLNTRGTMGGYWFPLRYMAIRDGNGVYASMLAPLEPGHCSLATLMEYPDLQKDLPAPAPIPEDYEKDYPLAGITRIRRGKTSVTILHKGNSRWITLRRGDAIINAVRFACPFFGKGQFVPASFEKRDGGFYFTQRLGGRYLQPITDPALLPVRNDAWSGLTTKRKMTQICTMIYEASIRETAQGFEISIDAQGTANVPLAIEINLREGVELSGVVAAGNADNAYLLKEGFAECRAGSDVIRIGPGRYEHAYIRVRGADSPLPGPSVYVTGYTPFKHTLTFQMG